MIERLTICDRVVKRRCVFFLFWSAILLVSVLIAGEAFATSTPYLTMEARGTAQEGTYVGSNICGTCHPDQKASWEETDHALAWNSSIYITPNRECYTCHVNGTNFETGKLIGEDLYGFTATNAPVVDGVSCETCHGPYQGGAGPGHMPVTLAAELCGECHSPFHSTHGQAYEKWSESAHAHAHTTLLESGVEVPRCIHCMSAEGAVPWPLEGVDTFAEVENGITCPVCHDPHTKEHEYQLREASTFELCITCHSHETTDEPHLLRGADCATCHMYGPQYSTRTESWDYPANHTMGAWVGACSQEGCHADGEAAWNAKDVLLARFDTRYLEVEEAVKVARAAFEAVSTTAGADSTKLAEAKAILEEMEDLWCEAELSSSLAFHFPWFLEKLLAETAEKAHEVVHLSEDAMGLGKTATFKETVTSTVSKYGLQILIALGLGSALLMAVFRRRRMD